MSDVRNLKVIQGAKGEKQFGQIIEKMTQGGISLEKFMGKIYFSEKQWRQLRDQGRPRTFAENASGQIIEFTEMHTFDHLKEFPGEVPIFADAEYRGEAFFHHREDKQGRWI